MKIPFRKIKQDLNTYKLSLVEKEDVLKSINLYMAENTVVQQSFSLNLFIRKNYMIPAIIIALLLATSGGTVAAAENSLPGDILYAVKLNVNEKVMSAAAVSDDAEADVQAKFVERRLQEYNKMLDKKVWSAEKEKQMADRLTVYQAKTSALIERLRAEGKSELADNIYDRMLAKVKSFEEFASMVKNASEEKGGSKMPEKIREMRNNLSGLDEVEKTPEGLKVSAEKHIRNATDSIAKLVEVYEAKKTTVEGTLKTYIESSLTEARDYLAQAEAKFSANEYQDAKELAKTSMQLAIKSRNFVNMVEHANGMMSEKKLEKLEAWKEKIENQDEQLQEGSQSGNKERNGVLREERKQEGEDSKEIEKAETEDEDNN